MRLSIAQILLNFVEHMEGAGIHKMNALEKHQVTKKTQQKALNWGVP